jgi:hypothetical protein
LQVLSDVVLERLVRSRGHELVPQLFAQSRRQLADFALLHAKQDLVGRPASEGQQPRAPQVGEIDQDSCAEAEGADSPARLLLDDTPHDERLAADDDPVAHVDAELHEQLRADERTPIAQERM